MIASTLLGKDLLAQPGVAFHTLLCQLDPSYQILAPRVWFKSVIFAILTELLHTKASLAKVGDAQSSSLSPTSFLLSMPSVIFPINPASKQSKRGDFYDTVGVCRPLTKMDLVLEINMSGVICFSLPGIRVISFLPHPHLHVPKLINIPTPCSPSFPFLFTI